MLTREEIQRWAATKENYAGDIDDILRDALLNLQMLDYTGDQHDKDDLIEIVCDFLRLGVKGTMQMETEELLNELVAQTEVWSIDSIERFEKLMEGWTDDE